MANEKLIKKIKLDGTTYILTDDGAARVDHSHDVTTTSTTAVTAINPGLGTFTPTTRYLHETTANAAPHTHTHDVTVSGTTGKNSGTGVSVVTGVASNGTATALTGVKVTAQPTISMAENSSPAAGRAQYVKSIDGGSGSLNVYSSDTTTTPETLPTSGRIPVVTGISGGSAVSKTTKYMKFTAGTTPKSAATPNHTSTVTEATGATAVEAVTGVAADGTATVLTGVKVTANPTIGLTANASTATGRIQYVESISGGSGSLTSNTTSTNGIKYVEAQGTFSAGTTPPKSASFSGTAATITPTLTGSLSGTCLTLSITGASYTPAGSVSFTAGTAPSMGAATTKYLHHSHSAASATTKYLSASASGTAIGPNGTATVLTGVKASSKADVAPIGHTHSYAKTTSVTLTAGTAPSMNFDTGSSSDTPYISAVSGGSAVGATTKYLLHGHTGASATTRYMSATASGTDVGAAGTATVLTGVKASGTTTVAPNEHTHTYGSSTALTTGGNSGEPVTVITDLTANTTAATGDIAYLESATHTHTGASVKSTDTVLKTVTID